MTKKQQQKSSHRSSEKDEQVCEVLFDATLLEPSKNDVKRIKNTKTSSMFAVKFAERTFAGLNSLDKCDKLWKKNEKHVVASKVASLASGPIYLIESLGHILSNAVGGPLKRGLKLKDSCKDEDEDEDEDEDDKEDKDE